MSTITNKDLSAIREVVRSELAPIRVTLVGPTGDEGLVGEMKEQKEQITDLRKWRDWIAGAIAALTSIFALHWIFLPKG